MVKYLQQDIGDDQPRPQQRKRREEQASEKPLLFEVQLIFSWETDCAFGR